jgi:DNA processing protein
MEDLRLKWRQSCWLALARGPAASGALLAELAAAPGKVDALFELRFDDIQAPVSASLRRYLRAPDWAGTESDLRWLAGGNGSLVMFPDPGFPDLLRNIPDPPPALFVRGNVPALNCPQIAVVGTRHPTPDGRRQAREFAAALAHLGIGITSGLALGVDAHAHAGALDAGGVTVAVLGCGPERIYPQRNSELAEKMMGRGAVISEFGIGTRPLAVNFPRRNRIISGLALGTLVVEATLRSGSLITAGTAAAQGREVFAIPGSIRNPMTQGCHQLIKQGAKLVMEVRDILEEIRELAICAADEVSSPQEDQIGPSGLDERAGLLLDSMGFGPVATDELVAQTGLAAGITASLLSRLEISGLVETLPGGRVIRKQSKYCQ